MGVQVFDIKPTLAEILEVGVPIGSMALGVPTATSDYDVYMTADAYYKLFKHSISQCLDAMDSAAYNAIQPRNGYCKIRYKFKTADNRNIEINMSNTKNHKDKGKFNNGLLDKIPTDLENMFNRHNNDWGEFRKAKKDLIDKIAEKELKTQIKNGETI